MTEVAGGTPPRVAIVVPPGGQLAYPFLGPASLKGYLEHFAIPVDLIDLNIVTFNDVANEVDNLFARLQITGPLLKEHFSDIPEVVHHVDFFLNMRPSGVRKLHRLRERLQDKELFRDDAAYFEILQRLSQLANLADLAYYPVRLLPGGIFARVRQFETLLTIETPYDVSLRRHMDEIDWSAYRVIGFSAFSFDQLVFALRMLSPLRPQTRGAVFAIGGNCLGEAHLPDRLKAFLASQFDVVVIGDGELPLLRTVEYALGQRDRRNIPNTLYRDGNRIVTNPEGYKYRFERKTRPDFSGLPMDLYPLPMPVLPVRFSNGCEWGRCTFCQESADKGAMSSRLAYQEADPADTAEYLRTLYDLWGASVFINSSSALTARGCIAVGEAIRQVELPLQWMSMVRAETAFTPSALQACAAGGAQALNFGVESFHPDVSRLMKKGMDLRQTSNILRNCHENRILVTCYTMVNFPGETVADYRYHLEQLEKHLDCIDFLFQSIFMLVVSAPVFLKRERYGIELDAAQMNAFLDDMFPMYLVPDEAYRRRDTQLSEKLNMYFHFLARQIRTRPLYFDRDFEIVGRHPYWEPEYNMLASQLESRIQLPGLSLNDMLASEVVIADDVVPEQLDESRCAVTLGSQDFVYYYPKHLGHLLTQLKAGVPFGAAFDGVVDEFQLSDRDVVEMYERLHRELRYLGALRFEAATDRQVEAAAAR